MIFVVAMTIRDALRKNDIERQLGHRREYDDDAFAARYYPREAAIADIAVRVRHILAANLELDLAGVRPEDRLDADLGAQVEANPDLFSDLETEFDIVTNVEDLDTHMANVARLGRFRDLVDFVVEKQGRS